MSALSAPHEAGPTDLQPEDRKRSGFLWWDVLLGLDLLLIALVFVDNMLAGPADPNVRYVPSDELAMLGWLNVIIGLVAFAVIPIVWLLGTRHRPLLGTWRWLGNENGERSSIFWVGIGCLGAVALYLAATLLGMILDAAGVAGGDPLFEALVRSGGWPLIIGLSFGAAVGEEVLFRGVLQRPLRWWGQAVVFGLVHINQGYAAVLFIVAVALLFGWMRHKGVPLWSLMILHFWYDVILFGELYFSL